MFKIKKKMSNSQRHLIQINRSELNKKKPFIKKKIKKSLNSSGWNNTGKITVFHKGGGHKKRYRIINFFWNYSSIGITLTIEYDPNRNAHIASIYDAYNKSFFYIIAPKDLKPGDIIKSGSFAEPSLGHCLPLTKIPIGSVIHNITKTPFTKSQITRAAGTYSVLKDRTKKKAIIELASKKHLIVSEDCLASLGIVSNTFFFLTQLGKAGRSRWLGIRPTVRGVAMNPIDHPHGGGEGKKSGKGKTPWGKPVKSAKKLKIEYSL